MNQQEKQPAPGDAIKKLIARGRIDLALESLLDLKTLSNDFRKEATLISCNFHFASSQFNGGKLAWQAYELTINRTVSRLMEIVSYL